MSFNTIEISNTSGVPVVLYEFVFGSTTWRYAGSENDIVIGAATYRSAAISDGGMTMSGDASADDLVITMPATEDVPNMLNGTPPSEQIWVNVRHHHQTDTEAPIVWTGYVASGRRTSSVAAEIKCRVLSASFDRNGLRLTWGRGCPHALYDINCKVVKESFAVDAVIATLTGNTFSVAGLGSYGADYFTGGMFRWSRFGGALEYRAIEKHVGATVTILGSSAGLSVGTSVTLFPGCNRTRTDCIGKFNNLPNYGGFPHLPGKSPFQGDPVF